jgi:hypothetical protein
MAFSYTANSLRHIRPNRFFKARFRNIRWNRDDTIVVDSAPVNDNKFVPTDPEVVNEQLINTLNNTDAKRERIRNRYNG